MEIQQLIEELQRAMQSSGPRARVEIGTQAERNGHFHNISSNVTAVTVRGVRIIIEAY